MGITIEPSTAGFVLQASQRLAFPIEEVFDFFSDAGNLERITPASVGFRILTPLPIVMRVGTLIDYRLQIRGIPVKWRTEITAWDPPHRFVDEQRRGPYRWWRHEHTFTECADETIVEDRVEYGVPGGGLVHRLFVGPDVRRIFEFRARALRDIFPA